MGSYQLSCFHFVSSEVFPQLGGFGSEALEKQLGIRMICHQFEPIEVLASDQALQWICYITWSRAGGAAAREYVGQEISDLCIVEVTAFSTLGHLFHFCMTGWWQPMACDDLFTVSPHLWANPLDTLANKSHLIWFIGPLKQLAVVLSASLARFWRRNWHQCR